MARRCYRVAVPGGGVAIVTVDDKRPRYAPCWSCGRQYATLCDFPIHRGKDGARHTCSRKLCADCGTKFGHKDLDFCPPHAVLIADNGIAARLTPLLGSGDLASHRVALDLCDSISVQPWPMYKAKSKADWNDFYAERAAIFEFEAGMERTDAERRARAIAGEFPT